MKTTLLCIVGLLVAFTLQKCAKDGESLSPQKVQFVCNVPAIGNDGGRLQTNPGPLSVLLSLQNSSHSVVFTGKVIKLLHIGDNYMTEPFELPPGAYSVTDFYLMDDSGEIFYATPKSGSPLSAIVTHPLPFAFTVSQNVTSNVDMEVVDVSHHTPEDFGYGSFGIHFVNPLNLSIFTTSGGQVNLTDAKAFILNGTDTLQSNDLEAKINTIPFKGNPTTTYQLIIVKNGYTSYHHDFVYNDLIANLGSLPWKIILSATSESGFTINAYVDANSSASFEFLIMGQAGASINVKWGDDTEANYNMVPIPQSIDDPSATPIHHTYAQLGNHLITITGDIDKITSIKSYYGSGMMDDIDLHKLTGLTNIRFGITRGPKVIDLSYNSQLVEVTLMAINELEQVIIPSVNNISELQISGPQNPAAHHLSAANVDDIVNKVYHTAVLHNRTNGLFEYQKDWTNYTGPMLGPPSESSLVKLRELRDTYHWTVHPEP